jgi:hypothetical protein
MNRRVTTAIAVALLSGALAAPAAQAGSQRLPLRPAPRSATSARLRATAARLSAFSAFSDLGHEGTGLHANVPDVSAFSGLGIEGDALVARWTAVENARWSAVTSALR